MTNERLNGKTAWEFACDWYTPDQIAYSIKNRHRMPSDTAIPDDIDSAGFAQWLTEQYRLAMTKGIQIAQQDSTARLAARKLFRRRVMDNNLVHELRKLCGQLDPYAECTNRVDYRCVVCRAADEIETILKEVELYERT